MERVTGVMGAWVLSQLKSLLDIWERVHNVFLNCEAMLFAKSKARQLEPSISTEAKLVLARLATDDQPSAAENIHIPGIPMQDVRAILDQLERSGLVVQRPGPSAGRSFYRSNLPVYAIPSGMRRTVAILIR